MKAYFIFILTGLYCLPNPAFSQEIVILKPNQVYQVPSGKESQVVMNVRTFAAYHYLSARHDTLKKEISKLDSLLTIQDSLFDVQSKSWDKLLFEKENELEVYRQTYARLKSSSDDCLKEQERLQAGYLKLEQRYERSRHWRNWLIGIAACLSTGIIISITK